MTTSSFIGLNRLFKLLTLPAALLVLAACESTPPASMLGSATAPAPTLLAPGDDIVLSFSGAPDLNQSQKIRPDGKINLPLIGEINASGETFAAFQTDVEMKYKSQLKDSDVLVTLDSSEDRSIIIDGCVQRPGNIPVDRPLTVFEAVMLAGGFGEDADMKKVQVFRLVHGVHQSQVVDLRGAMRGLPTAAVPVQAGDIIFVPTKLF
jgi:polysaccharide export outer membrane protein